VPWLERAPEAYAFSPAEAVAERRAAMRAARKSKIPLSQEDRAKPEPRRRPRERYDPRTYDHAIRYGCKRAGIEPWHPHQLRHGAATRLRREFGLAAARVILGHATASTTEIYAELDHRKVVEVMARVGLTVAL